MNVFARLLVSAAVVLGLAVTVVPAHAQEPAPAAPTSQAQVSTLRVSPYHYLFRDPHVLNAAADLAWQERVPLFRVRVVSYAQGHWADSSMGCPDPDRFYSPVLVPGRQLILSVRGQEFAYHAGANGAFSYCANPGSAFYPN